jgi:hypothetical protein
MAGPECIISSFLRGGSIGLESGGKREELGLGEGGGREREKGGGEGGWETEREGEERRERGKREVGMCAHLLERGIYSL